MVGAHRKFALLERFIQCKQVKLNSLQYLLGTATWVTLHKFLLTKSYTKGACIFMVFVKYPAGDFVSHLDC